MICSATISPCGRYRYTLARQWGAGPIAVFLMLNPSTADAYADDPTITRCIGFAKREGCSGLLVVNLFAYRATDPRELRKAREPVGPENDAYLRMALGSSHERRCHPVVAAWGAHPFAINRAREVYAEHGYAWSALGVTKDGHPSHPLYLRNDSPLIPWSPQGVGS